MTGVANVRLPDRQGLWDVLIDGARIGEIRPASGATGLVDGAGRLALPGFVDAHVHLDKAYQLDLAAEHGAFDDETAGLAAVLAATSRARAAEGSDAVAERIRRLLSAMGRAGTALARVHVEVDPPAAPGTVAMHRRIADEVGNPAVELCAFAQNGITGIDGMAQRMIRALDDGCSVVGGCPYTDADPRAHLDFVAGLAADRGLPLDLHLDLTDDPERSLIDETVRAVERYGLQGRVAAGHVTSLTAMDDQRATKAIAQLRDSGIGVVAIPTTDLWLSGRGSTSAPTRGVTRVRELLDAGVDVALASNNHVNAFTPVAAGSLLRVAWLASLVCHMGSPAEQRRLLDAITTTPAAMLGRPIWGVSKGAPASLVLVAAEDELDAVRHAPTVDVVIRDGALVNH